MTPRRIIAVAALLACAGVVGTTDSLLHAQTTSGQTPATGQVPATRDQPAPKVKAKPRRVIIFGTTIVGDVLKPTIDKTVPWQRPAAFRSNAAPLVHDFTSELLTPLDRDAILRDEGEHTH